MRLFLHRTIDVRQIVCKEVPSVPNKSGGWNKRVGWNLGKFNKRDAPSKRVDEKRDSVIQAHFTHIFQEKISVVS